MDITMIDPPIDQFEATLRKAFDEANAKGRSRTIDRQEAARITSDWIASTESVWELGGDGVPNSYSYRAETSLLGVAWFTDGMGRRHVRFFGKRITGKKSPYGRNKTHIFADPNDAPNWEARQVYPELEPPLLWRYERQGPRALAPELVALIDAIAEDVLDPLPRLGVIDWIEERMPQLKGGVLDVVQRKAVETIRRITTLVYG